jgi:hypothetical protein
VGNAGLQLKVIAWLYWYKLENVFGFVSCEEEFSKLLSRHRPGETKVKSRPGSRMEYKPGFWLTTFSRRQIRIIIRRMHLQRQWLRRVQQLDQNVALRPAKGYGLWRKYSLAVGIDPRLKVLPLSSLASGTEHFGGESRIEGKFPRFADFSLRCPWD